MIIKAGDRVAIRSGFWQGYTGRVKHFVTDGDDTQHALAVEVDNTLLGQQLGHDNVIVVETIAVEAL